MRVVLVPRRKGQIEFGIIYGSIACFTLLCASFSPLPALLPACAFRQLSGMPCPTCGSTHALLHLAQGEVMPALFFNPLFTLTMIFLLAAFVCSIVAAALKLRRLNFFSSKKERFVLKTAAVMLVILQWVYLIITRESLPNQ